MLLACVENGLSVIFFSSPPKAPGELIGKAVVRRRRCLSTLSNDISSETTGPIGPKFHLWHPWAWGLKVRVRVDIDL